MEERHFHSGDFPVLVPKLRDHVNGRRNRQKYITLGLWRMSSEIWVGGDVMPLARQILTSPRVGAFRALAPRAIDETLPL